METLRCRAKDPFDHGFVQALVRKNLSLGEGGTDRVLLYVDERPAFIFERPVQASTDRYGLAAFILAVLARDADFAGGRKEDRASFTALCVHVPEPREGAPFCSFPVGSLELAGFKKPPLPDFNPATIGEFLERLKDLRPQPVPCP